MGTHIQSRRKTNLVCPICRETGGSLQKKWASTEPHVPKLETITNLSTGWDYAAKVLLILRENYILLPPDRSLDEAIAAAIYDHFSGFTPYSKEELMDFELKHLSTPAKSIKKRMSYFASRSKEPCEPFFADGTPKGKKSDPIHLRLPTYAGTVGKASVACLYGAIICCALRDLSILLQQSFSKEENQGFAYGIYAYFRLFEYDARHSLSFVPMLRTMAEIQKYGRHGAARINALSSSYCLHCDKRGKGKNVQMERIEESQTGWKCPQCGSSEPKRVPFSSKHLRDIEYKMLKKSTIVTESLPLYFEDIIPMYKDRIQNSPNVKEDFLECFKKYELQASKDLLGKRERWIITHYDSKLKSKRRQCRIPPDKFADIEINDERYSLYKSSIAIVVEAIPKNRTADERNLMFFGNAAKMKVYELLGEMLKELGWPERFIMDKVIHDISHTLAKR